MALESCGTITAKQIDLAFQLCHDLILEEGNSTGSLPEDTEFSASVHGIWSVRPGSLNGKPAVEIRISVG